MEMLLQKRMLLYLLEEMENVSFCSVSHSCLLYTSDAADDSVCVDLGGRRIIKKIF